MNYFHDKYIKYKSKYLLLQTGGVLPDSEIDKLISQFSHEYPQYLTSKQSILQKNNMINLLLNIYNNKFDVRSTRLDQAICDNFKSLIMISTVPTRQQKNKIDLILLNLFPGYNKNLVDDPSIPPNIPVPRFSRRDGDTPAQPSTPTQDNRPIRRPNATTSQSNPPNSTSPSRRPTTGPIRRPGSSPDIRPSRPEVSSRFLESTNPGSSMRRSQLQKPLPPSKKTSTNGETVDEIVNLFMKYYEADDGRGLLSIYSTFEAMPEEKYQLIKDIIAFRTMKLEYYKNSALFVTETLEKRLIISQMLYDDFINNMKKPLSNEIISSQLKILFIRINNLFYPEECIKMYKDSVQLLRDNLKKYYTATDLDTLLKYIDTIHDEVKLTYKYINFTQPSPLGILFSWRMLLIIPIIDKLLAQSTLYVDVDEIEMSTFLKEGVNLTYYKKNDKNEFIVLRRISSTESFRDDTRQGIAVNGFDLPSKNGSVYIKLNDLKSVEKTESILPIIEKLLTKSTSFVNVEAHDMSYFLLNGAYPYYYTKNYSDHKNYTGFIILEDILHPDDVSRIMASGLKIYMDLCYLKCIKTKELKIPQQIEMLSTLQISQIMPTITNLVTRSKSYVSVGDRFLYENYRSLDVIFYKINNKPEIISLGKISSVSYDGQDMDVVITGENGLDIPDPAYIKLDDLNSIPKTTSTQPIIDKLLTQSTTFVNVISDDIYQFFKNGIYPKYYTLERNGEFTIIDYITEKMIFSDIEARNYKGNQVCIKLDELNSIMTIKSK